VQLPRRPCLEPYANPTQRSNSSIYLLSLHFKTSQLVYQSQSGSLLQKFDHPATMLTAQRNLALTARAPARFSPSLPTRAAGHTLVIGRFRSVQCGDKHLQ
jgi:hypothetical protein